MAPRYRPIRPVKELAPEAVEARQKEKELRTQSWIRRAEDFVRHTVEGVEGALREIASQKQTWYSNRPPARHGIKARLHAPTSLVPIKARRALIKLCIATQGDIRKADETIRKLRSSGARIDPQLAKKAAEIKRAMDGETEYQQKELRRALVGNASVVRPK